ncbi:MAG: hypothetical protein KY395_04730 [Actinobacteria bacterium]|nr:hypothetical protein [Actinomycetota bacterium]
MPGHSSQHEGALRRSFVDWRDRYAEGPWPRGGQSVTVSEGRCAVVGVAHGPKITVELVGEAAL